MLNLITFRKPVNNLFKNSLLARITFIYSFLLTGFNFVALKKLFLKIGFWGYKQINSTTTNYY